MLTIQETINKLIKQKGMSKKEFAQKLINLKPLVNRIGKVPSISTIYSYLNGRINIPVELISYVADILDVSEQEIFDTSSKAKKCYKRRIEFFSTFINSQIQNNVNVNYDKIILNAKSSDEKIDLFANLLKYAPIDFIDNAINKLQEYKKLIYTF